jgi:hypothetical protein
MIQWFVDSSSEQSVPLGSQYLASGGSVGDETTVTEAILNGTGLLLVGTKFKGMVFNNKDVYRQLLVALDLYCADLTQSCQLTIRVKANGYVDVGADFGTAGCAAWFKDGNRYSFRTEVRAASSNGNPFVRSPETPTVSDAVRARKQKG